MEAPDLLKPVQRIRERPHVAAIYLAISRRVIQGAQLRPLNMEAGRTFRNRVA
jgi:hypothetical protein